MEINFTLRSGLVLHDAAGMLVEKFHQWPWDKYDGDTPVDPNRVDPKKDIDRVYQLGMRAPKLAFVNLVQSHSEKFTECLRAIPTDKALEDVDLDLLKTPIVKLFNAACGSKHVKMAGATKLLYPFRPSLLPVIDSVVDYYYWYATSIRDEPTFRKMGAIDTWGEYIFEILCLIKNDLDGARTAIDEVLAACKQYNFSSASRVRVLESLIWYYYARSGSTVSDVEE